MAKHIKIAAIGGSAPRYDKYMSVSEINHIILKHFEAKLESVLTDKPDLIVFPEMCDFALDEPMAHNIAYIKERGSDILDFICATAQKNNTFVAYSTTRVLESGSLAQSTYFIDRNGNALGIYNKHCLTIGELENGYQCGSKEMVIACELGRVGFVTCFDLNFQSLCDQYIKQDVDLLVFSSVFHGGLMQNHWAYANRAFFVGAVHNLPCGIIAPNGETIASSTHYYNYIVKDINLDFEVFHLDFNAEKLRLAKQKYGGAIRIQDSGFLGSIVLYSESYDFTVKDMIKEFGLESLDHYMQRAELLQIQNRYESSRG
ncbi:MAG: hypothetical protein LBL96_03740 [Clostridiales bacterium]|jgi:hypothetical protein|nr:hypothetical protein [Clostridiales bacterium]